mgnify:CR=1 FL=1
MDTLLQSVSPRGVATLTFNRPDRANSYTAEMLDALADGFERFGKDGEPTLRERVAAALGTRVEVVAGAAHNPQFSHPERFNAILRDFLGG